MFFFLNFLIIFLIAISNSDFEIEGEGFVEILQLVILISCFFIHFRCKKMFLELSNLFIFNIRLLLFTFLIYEEMSFIIPSLSTLINNINRQNEINIHNLNLLSNFFLKINIPGLNYSFSLSLAVFSISVFLFLYGNGLFLPILKKFRYLFLEKHFSLFSYVFLVNLIISSIIRRYFDASFMYLMDLELVELFLYIVLLLDVVKKMNIVKKLTS
tara:strand:- start:154 stop:795 length:642 start_codon:yes stop_codon:yes gene_type:complete